VGAAGDGAFRERARRGAVRVTHLIWLAVAFWLVKQPSSESLCLWDGTFSSCRYLPCAGTATWDEHEHEHEHVGKRSGWVADRAHVHVKVLVNLYLTKRGKYRGLGVRPRRLPFSTVGSAVRTGQIGQISTILPNTPLLYQNQPAVQESLRGWIPCLGWRPSRAVAHRAWGRRPARCASEPVRPEVLEITPPPPWIVAPQPSWPSHAQGSHCAPRVRGAGEGSSTPDRQAPPGRVPCHLLLAPPPCYRPPSPPGCAAACPLPVLQGPCGRRTPSHPLLTATLRRLKGLA
jgi:hypothetical protein